jgi:hypothetical protein
VRFDPVMLEGAGNGLPVACWQALRTRLVDQGSSPDIPRILISLLVGGVPVTELASTNAVT